jgi:hypothetical protein
MLQAKAGRAVKDAGKFCFVFKILFVYLFFFLIFISSLYFFLRKAPLLMPNPKRTI